MFVIIGTRTQTKASVCIVTSISCTSYCEYGYTPMLQ